MQLPANRHQFMLLPPCLDEFVDPAHPVRFVVEVVERLELSAFKVGTSGTGRPAYPTESMVSMMFYALSIGAFSAREMARRCRTDCAFMFATAGWKPSHQTISRFRSTHQVALAALFADVVIVLRRAGVGSLDVTAVDGTRQYASASLDKHTTTKQLEKQLERERKCMTELLEQCAREDSNSEDDDDSDSLPPHLKSQRKRVAAIEKTLDEFRTAGINQRNDTDPDAKLQRCHRGNRPGYNAQAAATGDGYVVAADVTNDPSDKKQLLPMLDQIEANTQDRVGVFLADAGYENGDNVQALIERDQDAIVASSAAKGAHGMHAKTGRIQWIDFEYDHETDEYICPDKRRLLYVKSTRDKTNDRERRLYRSASCEDCSHATRCLTKRKKTRELTLLATTPALMVMSERRQNDRIGARLFARRKTIAETTFAHLKHNLRWCHFMRRGLVACQSEFRTLCAAVNIAKLGRHLHASNLTLDEAFSR